MIVWLSGPTGAGKTSIARLLSASGYSVVEERAPESLFRAFARDPRAACEPLQRYLMHARAEAFRTILHSPFILFDRSIDEDIAVFCEMHKRAGLLTPEQFDNLSHLAATLQDQIPAPDLIVFVTADYEVLLRRVRSADAPPVIAENLEIQMLLYAEWSQRRTEEILKVDTTRSTNTTLAKLILEGRAC